VRCNTFTKFRDLLVHADALDCEYVATGHYAISRDGALFRGRDGDKDQTYFLWGVDRAVVGRMLTPVGSLTKDETRAMARRLSLVTADKQESVEICFVPDGDYMKVLERHLDADAPALAPGPIRTASGAVIGEHDGYARYTVGQRRRLPGGSREPLFVLSIVPEERAVVVGTAEELCGSRVDLAEVNWLAPALQPGDDCDIQVRYRARPAPARVRDAPSTDGRLTLELREPVRAITPGQSGVLYHGDRLIGGGVID
jgi:tRNA-specific 2-thiouridylase